MLPVVSEKEILSWGNLVDLLTRITTIHRIAKRMTYALLIEIRLIEQGRSSRTMLNEYIAIPNNYSLGREPYDAMKKMPAGICHGIVHHDIAALWL
jgi:hypothetical protein